MEKEKEKRVNGGMLPSRVTDRGLKGCFTDMMWKCAMQRKRGELGMLLGGPSGFAEAQ